MSARSLIVAAQRWDGCFMDSGLVAACIQPVPTPAQLGGKLVGMGQPHHAATASDAHGLG
jgi:hypothetical protein